MFKDLSSHQDLKVLQCYWLHPIYKDERFVPAPLRSPRWHEAPLAHVQRELLGLANSNKLQPQVRLLVQTPVDKRMQIL